VDNRAFVLEFPCGGIGDIFYWMWNDGKYANLEHLKDGEFAIVLNRCRAPGIEEFFLWHPKREQIYYRDLRDFPRDSMNAEDRKALGVPEPSGYVPMTNKPRFFPSPEDTKLLKAWEGRQYVVFAMSGSYPEKNVPPSVAESIADVLIEIGVEIAVVGKTYTRMVSDGSKVIGNKRHEERLAKRAGVTDLIDQLTIPGACEFVRQAAGVVCCDSSIMHASLRQERPTYIVLPDAWHDSWLSISFACWGKDLPYCTYTKVSSFETKSALDWIKRNKIGGEKP
jgi:hypothetical protein